MLVKGPAHRLFSLRTGGIKMTEEARKRYFDELSRTLYRRGFATGPAGNDGLLPVQWRGQQLCHVTGEGGVRYFPDAVREINGGDAVQQVTRIARVTAKYMSQLEAAPQLTASGLTGDYRLLAEFNDTVLAGHPTKYGIQFITWEWVRNGTGLYQGNYYGPDVGVDDYAAAKRSFAIRSGLIPHSALFVPEQLAEVYRSIHETLDSGYPITTERRKLLEGVAEQIKDAVPDLEERVSLSNQKELELVGGGTQQGMKF